MDRLAGAHDDEVVARGDSVGGAGGGDALLAPADADHRGHVLVAESRLPQTVAAGTGVIAFCPLAQGALTDRYLAGLPADSRRGRQGERGRQWYEQQRAAGVWDKVARLREVAAARGQTTAQLALTWLLRDERVTSVLIGVSGAAAEPGGAEANRRDPGGLTPCVLWVL